VRVVQQTTAGLAFCICASTSAPAQPVLAAELPPVEVGIAVDWTRMRAGLYLDSKVVVESMANVRLTRPFTPSLAFEGIFAAGRGIGSYDYHTRAVYALQVKQRLWRRANGDLHVFATYGAAGVWRQIRVYGRSGPRIDDESHGPLYAVAGAGFQWELAARAALRVEAQGVAAFGYAPVGMRLSAGVSIPFRPYRN